jgi:tRNA-Thr(GGU) m(6)t(6)A37 methyltransferase TsaA
VREMKIELKPIGIIHSPYKTKEEIPIQAYLSDEEGEVEVFKEYEDGLKDVEGFSHIIIVYIFHKSMGYSLHVKPYLDPNLKGVFATRHPNRPNPVGISTVRLLERKEKVLRIKGMDVIDGTPLIDLKPYVPRFDERMEVKFGWLEGKLLK